MERLTSDAGEMCAGSQRTYLGIGQSAALGIQPHDEGLAITPIIRGGGIVVDVECREQGSFCEVNASTHTRGVSAPPLSNNTHQ